MEITNPKEDNNTNMYTISDRIQDMLCKQVSHELTNANIYIYVSDYFSNFELNNFAKMYLKQSDEEKSHANMIIQFMQDLDYIYTPQPVQNDEPHFESVIDAVQLVFNTELETTYSLNEIAKACLAEGDHLTYDFISQMLREQREEIASSREIFTKVKNIQANHGFLIQIDSTL